MTTLTGTRRAVALAALGLAASVPALPGADAATAPIPSPPVSTTVVRTTTVPAVSYPPLATPVRGQDISWPNCPKGMGIASRPTQGKPMPSSTAKLVLVGLTNGPAFTPNPCLAAQAAWVKAHHVYAGPYAVISYPSAATITTYAHAGPYRGDTLTSRLRNVGWAQGTYNLARMRAAGLAAPFIWADVEVPPTGPWSSSRSRNKAVFDGALAAYRAAGIRVGLYTTRSQWAGIMGSARYGLAEWHTTGPSSLTTAKKACTATSFNGGRTVLAQWWTTANDYDVVCPGFDTVTAMRQYFHKF